MSPEKKRLLTILTVAFIGATAAAAVYYSGPTSSENSGGAKRDVLVVSTTTSLFDTGLLDVLEDDFESMYPINLYFIPVGTGLAIIQGQRGDADAVLVHAPAKEFKFMEEGYGVARKIIAYNFFVIVGPPEDPVELRGRSVTDALNRVVDAGRRGEAVWVSRGDDSGTHTKEMDLWRSAGYETSEFLEEAWYIEAGSGMSSTLVMASEMSAYTLSDTGTYLKQKTDRTVHLEALVDPEEELINTYSVVAANPDKIEGVNFEGAVTFIEYLISDDTQNLIGRYGEDRFPNKLFFPAVRLLETGSDIEARWISEYAFLDGSECPPLYRAGQNQLYG